MPGRKPKRILCRMLGEYRDAQEHVLKFCKFYAGQPYKPTLGNEACHTECSVPKRFDVPGLAKADEQD